MRQAFDEFESLPSTAHVQRNKLAARMIDLITVHTFLRREVLYPRITALVPGVDGELTSVHDEHADAERVAAELWTMRPEDERFSERVARLISTVRSHLDAQERHWFPRLVAAVEPNELDAIRAELQRARRRAPSSPRPGGA